MKAYLEGKDLILQYETPFEEQRIKMFLSHIMTDKPVIGGELVFGQDEQGHIKRGFYLEVVKNEDQFK